MPAPAIQFLTDADAGFYWFSLAMSVLTVDMYKKGLRYSINRRHAAATRQLTILRNEAGASEDSFRTSSNCRKSRLRTTAVLGACSSQMGVRISQAAPIYGSVDYYALPKMFD